MALSESLQHILRSAVEQYPNHDHLREMGPSELLDDGVVNALKAHFGSDDPTAAELLTHRQGAEQYLAGLLGMC